MILKQVILYTNAPAIEATWVRRDQMPDVEVPATPALYDKDGNEVQAAVEAHTRPGEVIETVLKCHAYSNHPEQIAMLRADLGSDAAQYEELIAEVEATYVPPEPQPPVPIKFSSLDFLDLFTESEQLAVASAAMTNVQAKLWYDRTLAAEFVTLEDPRTEAGLDALVVMGLIAATRKAEIAGAMVA